MTLLLDPRRLPEEEQRALYRESGLDPDWDKDEDEDLEEDSEENDQEK